MTEPGSKYYITTAIDYSNGAPHIGHAYEKIIADFYARVARLQGAETWFLIGLDEHGLKMQETAEKAGQTPQDYVDGKADVFRQMYERLEVSSDDFIRTSEDRHRRYAQGIYEKVRDQGDIYKGLYKTDYCVSCEKPLQKSEVEACEALGHRLTTIDEETYFFRLGKYREAVRDHIQKHPEFVTPEERRNEVLSRLDDEVFDLSISRSSFKWGVPLPDDPQHVLYVWFDALSNYISALTAPDESRQRFWPADCHVIGKDILWFHAVIWPAMLLSAGIPLPGRIYVHGFILDKDGRKMAKSLGNAVDPQAIVEEYGVEVLRFYFLKAFSSGPDARFSIEDLEDRYQNELGNDLGNLVMRLSKLVLSRAGGELPPEGAADDLGVERVVSEYLGHVNAMEHHKALEALWAFLRANNAYLNEKAPWKVAEEPEVRRILYGSLEAMSVALHLLSPAMPEVAASAAKTLGIPLGELARREAGKTTYKVEPARALFPRRDRPEKAEAKSTKKQGKASSSGGGGPVDPFAKLELRVGQIEEVREHPDADSLFAMTVDIGGDKRSVCAGLRAHLRSEELAGRKVVVVANLKPAMLRGVESRGMVLASDRKDGKVVPIDPGDAPSGALVTVPGVESRPKKKLSKSEFGKAPLTVQGGKVTYSGNTLVTESGDVTCDSDDGAPVR